jgi:alpha-galactosidase
MLGILNTCHPSICKLPNVKVSDLGVIGEVKSARDLWKHIDVAFRDGVYTAKLPSHRVVMLRGSGGR